MSLTGPTANQPSPWRLALALGWLLGFAGLFYLLTPTLPNNPDFTRLQVIGKAWYWALEAVDPHEASVAGWEYFPQRLPILLAAAAILASAWALGRLAWRAIGPAEETDRRLATGLSMGVGLSGVSLLTLACGLAGGLNRWCLGTVLALPVAIELALWIRGRRGHQPNMAAAAEAVSGEPNNVVAFRRLLTSAAWGLILLFCFFQLFGAMLPSIDFDVKEYHLQGPKEFYQQGRITFLAHNVYTSFPFLTEMLSLAGMVVAGDWWTGALVGKAVLMSFAPLTALVLFVAGRRWFSTNAGIAAALVYLTIPWTTRLSIIALVEGGLCFFVAATLLASGLAIERIRQGLPSGRAVLLTGLLAGSGMAVKYPGLIQVVLPALVVLMGAAVRWRGGASRGRAGGRTAAVFLCGVAVTVGPWLLKNLVETGNPVYPLAYTVFGGRDWSDADNAKWRAGHSADNYSLVDLANHTIDVVSRSDWQSPLVFGLAPLALLVVSRRRLVVTLWLLVAWLFFSWWALTHRLDRFWLPLLPVASLLAGVGMTWSRQRGWWAGCIGVVLFGLVHNIGIVASPRVGYNAFLADLPAARLACQVPGIRDLNATLPRDGQVVLCVGEAQVFDAEFPIRYNTVFDQSLLEDWCRGDGGRLATAELIRARLKSERIGWVLVNWREILRYRTSYGYTDFVTPELFDRLVKMGILDAGRPLALSMNPIAKLRSPARKQMQTWGKGLAVERLEVIPPRLPESPGTPFYITLQLYRVK